ncbi:MAG: nucleoside triphosphate pyrophosphohydrolase [Gammaproteobacteria bacterium]
MARLRDPQTGCPWDVEQTFSTIAPYTIEEAYEVADAIERDAMDELRDELGDLLFQVVFHARMAEEAGHFRFDDVVEAICDKMERRHPHVFGDASIDSAEEQSRAWEQHKSAERAHHDSVLDGVALALPALMRAEKLQRRAARLGFDWPDIGGPLAKCHEEIAEIEQALQKQDQNEIESEIGDLLFSVVNLARFAHVDPEEALRRSSLNFTQRFKHVEQAVKAGGRAMSGMSLEELDALWEKAKQRLAEEAD